MQAGCLAVLGAQYLMLDYFAGVTPALPMILKNRQPSSTLSYPGKGEINCRWKRAHK